MAKGHPWQQRVQGWSYKKTARAFDVVQRLWPTNSLVYVVISDELHRKARIVFLGVARKRIIQPDREDFVAECMAKMARGIERFRAGNFQGWLATIANNTATDAWRKRTRRREIIPAILSLEEMADSEIGTPDRAEHDSALATEQHLEEEAILDEFLRRVEDHLGSVARGVLEMKMSGVADEHIADFYGIEPLGVGAILKGIGQLYNAY